MAGHVLMVSVLGGAVLERYLVPVLPLLYLGFAAAFWQYRMRWRIMSAGALIAALIAGNFVNPLYPFPLENNLAFTDFVTLQAASRGVPGNAYSSSQNCDHLSLCFRVAAARIRLCTAFAPGS